MKDMFDPDAFIQRIGCRLVEEFEIARNATSPSTVGAAMEQPVRKQLEQILPRGIGVGTGFVIDMYGETSRQNDIVLYGKNICPKAPVYPGAFGLFPFLIVRAIFAE